MPRERAGTYIWRCPASIDRTYIIDDTAFWYPQLTIVAAGDLILRILVYEYVDNGNLEQWLHGNVGPVSPLTWDIRMDIVLGTAKGY